MHHTPTPHKSNDYKIMLLHKQEWGVHQLADQPRGGNMVKCLTQSMLHHSLCRLWSVRLRATLP